MDRVHRIRRDEGFSVVELVVVMLVLSIAVAVLTDALASTMRSTRDVEARSEALASARIAVEAITRDLRAGNPLDAVSPVSLYDTQVSFTTWCADAGVGSCSSRNRRHVVWRVADHALTRTVDSGGVGGVQMVRVLAGPTGPAGLPASRRAGAIVHDSSEPVFRYYDARGARLSTSALSGAPATSFRDCVRTVAVHLGVVPRPGAPSAYDIDTTVELRNFQEVQGC